MYHRHPVIGFTPNPNSPLERYYSESAPAAYGQDPFSQFAAGAVTSLLDDPRAQTFLDDLGVECQSRAQEGVTLWMKDNWGYLVAAGAALIGINYLVLVFGVLPTVQRAARGR